MAAGKEEPFARAQAELAGTHYEPLHHLASGTFGDVFVVRHRDLDTEVVLKLLKPEYKTQDDIVERLRVEARILTKLKHENLLRVTDFGWAKSGQPYLVSEKLEGEPLSDVLKRDKTLPFDDAIDLTIQILRALSIVHEAKLVHRDIKPANLFLVKGERRLIKLLDFGIAKILDSEGAGFGRPIKTAEGMVLGTPAYLAPEQILGDPIDARSDLYAVAGVLYRILTGKQMFVTRTYEELIIAQVTQVPDLVSVHTPEAERLDAVVARGLAKKPRDRFQTADEFIAALEAARSSNVAPAVTSAAEVLNGAAAAPLAKLEVKPVTTPKGGTVRMLPDALPDGEEPSALYMTSPLGKQLAALPESEADDTERLGPDFTLSVREEARLKPKSTKASPAAARSEAGEFDLTRFISVAVSVTALLIIAFLLWQLR